MGGDLTLREIAIDPEAIDPEEAEMLAEMVQAAVNEGLRAAQELAELEDGRDHRRLAASAGRRAGGLRAVEHRGPGTARRASSPSSRGCRGSASGPRSGSPSTCCARPTKRPSRSATRSAK